MYMCADSVRDAPGNTGAVIHEMAHLTQKYAERIDGTTAPGWVVEGIAEYTMLKLGYTMSYIGPGCTKSPWRKYTAGYDCAAALFNYIERVYTPNAVKNIHTAGNNGSYTDAVVTQGTGKTLSQLWSECLSAECKGGSS